MDFKRVLAIIALAAGIILVAVFSWKISGNRSYSAGYSDALASIKPDTEYVDKPIYIDHPVPVIKYRDTGRVVYVPVIVKDSTGHADTTAAPMHPEVKQYEDSTYRAQVSGIQPNLDWIEVYQRTFYITKVVPEYKYPSFALSPSIGAFVAPGHFSFGGGLALDYWKDRWQLSVEGGYGIHSDLQTITPGWYGKVGIKYNLIRK
ncbi:MAG: hypothetical protein J6Y20_04710 [Lachnospiraceae bacterium]|nr:hypothetical protein [Kiritimatiellia bacterium]MBP5461407.1 hypothetical protein [Lachnospiraceae bacterium]